jgi:hypothetical protein
LATHELLNRCDLAHEVGNDDEVVQLVIRPIMYLPTIFIRRNEFDYTQLINIVIVKG